ncbi:hypothetical protein SK128_018803 [Halocaridina rubra]|uniref:Uncharacterized protein n=1 Tax=Halocaridina rubra TaxID=373956 RepID=A0AAN8XI69_HALRR
MNHSKEMKMRHPFCIIALTIFVILGTYPTHGWKLPHRIPPFSRTIGSLEAPYITYQKKPSKEIGKQLQKNALGISEQCYETGERNHATTIEGHIEPSHLRGLEKTLKRIADMSHEGQKVDKEIPPSLQRLLDREAEKQRRYLKKTSKIFFCPKAEDIYPCICDSSTITFNCTAMGNFTFIQEIFNTVTFPQKNFVTFIMRGMGQGDDNENTLWSNIFGSVSFQEILIENTQVVDVQDNAFAGSEATLKVIQMQHNTKLRIFPFHRLYQFGQLEELLLGYGSIQEVQNLQNVAKLHTIYLNFNKIDQLLPKTFANLPMLAVLDLGFNNLQTIVADDMMFASHDAFIYLDENLLTNMDDQAFSGALPSLLDVSNNLLTSFNMALFKPILDNIVDKGFNTWVDVSENPLCCTDIEWVLNDPTYSDHIGLPDINCTNIREQRLVKKF